MIAPIRYTVENYGANLKASGACDDRAELLRELGSHGPEFFHELAKHLDKAPTKARRDLEAFEGRLVAAKQFAEFSPFQLRLAVAEVQKSIASLPIAGKKRGRKAGLAHQALQRAVSEVRVTLEAAGTATIRANALAFAVELADNSEWLMTRPEVAAMSREVRIEQIVDALLAQAPRLAGEFWANTMPGGQGMLGELGTSLKLLEMAESVFSERVHQVLFDDPEKPEYADGRDIPIRAAAKSMAVQSSKRRRRKSASAE